MMKPSHVIAVALAVGAAAWVASGQLFHPAPQTTETTGASAALPAQPSVRPLTKVRAMRSRSEPVMEELVLMGHTRANRRVELRAEVDGRVESVLVERGRPVRAGDPIVTLAPEDRPSRVAEAKALVDQREREFEAARSLSSKGFNSEIRLAEAAALLEAARADLARAEVALDRLTIRAPFDGVLERRLVEVGDYLSAADPIGLLVDLDPIRVVAQVTERAVSGLSLGQQGRADLITGTAVTGEMAFIAAAADPATRTFKVELSAPNPANAIMEGLTARLNLPLAERTGHLAPLSALVLADDGTLGVKTVDEENRARFWPVSIVKDSPDGVWLAGLPDEIGLIILGQSFVVDGEHVDPVWMSPQLARAE